MSLFAALAATGVAAGGTSEPKLFTGSFEQGGTISLQLHRGNEKKVRYISIDRMSGRCEDGSGAQLSFSIEGGTPVLSDRSFAVRSKDGKGGKAIVRGRFSRGFKRVKGSARIYGRIHFTDGQTRKCDSGRQKYLGKVSVGLRAGSETRNG
jgi:hypothetical protein